MSRPRVLVADQIAEDGIARLRDAADLEVRTKLPEAAAAAASSPSTRSPSVCCGGPGPSRWWARRGSGWTKSTWRRRIGDGPAERAIAATRGCKVVLQLVGSRVGQLEVEYQASWPSAADHARGMTDGMSDLRYVVLGDVG